MTKEQPGEQNANTQYMPDYPAEQGKFRSPEQKAAPQIPDKREPLGESDHTAVHLRANSADEVSVSADAAVLAPDVAAMAKRLREYADKPLSGHYLATVHNVLREAAAIIEKLGQGWIPMSERLPVGPNDPSTAARVLVWTIKDGMGWIAVRFYRRPEWTKTHAEWWSGGDAVDGEIITHWMPLPPPPPERP